MKDSVYSTINEDHNRHRLASKSKMKERKEVCPFFQHFSSLLVNDFIYEIVRISFLSCHSVLSLSAPMNSSTFRVWWKSIIAENRKNIEALFHLLTSFLFVAPANVMGMGGRKLKETHSGMLLDYCGRMSSRVSEWVGYVNEISFPWTRKAASLPHEPNKISLHTMRQLDLARDEAKIVNINKWRSYSN